MSQHFLQVFSFLEAIRAMPKFCTCHGQVPLSFSEITLCILVQALACFVSCFT